MTSRPLVTIGCAVYNGEQTLERALATLVAQDYPDIEILIGDDCSTDRSLEICEAAARLDARVKVIRNVRQLGIVDNVNALFRRASGKYFMWADQDDLRDPTFVRKAVAVLEADPDAVLCHSYSGVFVGEPADIKLIVSFTAVNGVASPLVRYWRFLREYGDTTIYGLIRTEALRRTRLWRPDLGSANALLFELLLLGKFVEIPEVLYFYSGRGVRNRPTPEQEYERQSAGRKMPWYYRPFAVLAINQTDGIRRSPLGLPAKAALLLMLWAHVCAVAGTKLLYRLLHRLSFGHVPDVLTRVCDAIVDPRTHYRFVNHADRDEQLFPRAWVLRGRS